MKPIWMTTILALLLFVGTCNSARILAIQYTSVRSHHIVMEPLYEELASRGHQLTLFTSFPHKPPIPNLQEVDLTLILPPLVSSYSYDSIQEEMSNLFKSLLSFSDFGLFICEKILADDSIKRLLKSDEKFDLIMIETYFTDCFVPLAHKFNAPLVAFMSGSVLPWVTDRAGLPDNPSYIPSFLTDSSTDMTFTQRVYNTLVLSTAKLIYRYYSVPKTQCLIDQYLGDSFPPLDSLVKNTALTFVNTHPSMFLSRPFPPNVVEIGGIHIRNSSKPIPKDLLNILDQSPKGVILVSFGSLIRVSTIPEHIIRMFMKVFSTIPQTVIFKYEDELPEAPSNVVIRKWLPQQQILEHKNVKLLLAHGGMSSTLESIYFAKPLIGIPFFADQYMNIKAVVRRGAGVMLDLHSLSEEKIEMAIKDVLNDSKYTENVRQLSLQFRDRPMSPLQTAVYWTEYVIRHQGAQHLRPASVSLPIYQYLLLDVIAVLMLPLLFLMYIIYFLFFKAVEVSPNDYRNYKLKEN